MEQTIKEILIRIDYLEKLISSIQQNLNSNIQAFLTCLTLIVATTGVAIVYYVKVTVNKRVEKELIVIKENLKSELKRELYHDLKEHIATNHSTGHAYGTSGTIFNNVFTVTGLMMKEEDIVKFKLYKFEVISPLTKKSLEHEVTYRMINDIIVLDVHMNEYNASKDGIYLKWSIMWANKESNSN